MANHTNGHRIYAIGDIHGCLDELEQVQNNIRQDLQNRPHPQPVSIYLGDYIDRGPDSRGVIENLMAEDAAPHRTHMLLGNHDEMLLTYRQDPSAPIRPNGPMVNKIHWLHELGGGAATQRSLEHYVRLGSYMFVHAGINPDASLENQTLDNFIWIREPFLSSTLDHGFTVVHGHTPVKEVENHGNRIAIDTGAVFNGALSCLIVEDAKQSLLTNIGPVPCPTL